jgi:hypothetical protein
VHTPEGTPLPRNVLAELQRDSKHPAKAAG